MKEAEDKKEYFIWKAKHQRGLSDEQINYFFARDSRWDLLPHYALMVKRTNPQEALEEIIRVYGEDS